MKLFAASLAALWVWCAASAGVVCADEFTLKDGRTCRGKIVAQAGDEYLVKTEDGIVHVPINQIRKIKKDPSPRPPRVEATQPASSEKPQN